jgi:signal peptide peptidase SppA
MGSRGAGQQSGAVAVLPLVGVLGTHESMHVTTPTQQFAKDFRAFDASPGIGTIVVWIDSPGGTVSGTMEAADAIFAARKRGQTRTISVVDPMMASAATWIGTAAKEVVITPSGEAGSIGVISMYEDWSAALEKMGISIAVVRTPAKKARFTGVESLTPEMQEHMQRRNEQAYAQFVGAVSRNRSVSTSSVVAKFGNGEMLSASEARAAGLVDAIAPLHEVIDDAAAGRKAGRRRAAAATLSPRARAARAKLRLLEL